jgi:hypothetical protein
MQQFNLAGKPCTPNIPWLVDNINQPFATEAVSEVVNLVLYEKDAAVSTVVIPLPGKRIFDQRGGKIGSYWGNEANLQYATPDDTNVISGVVLTDTLAAVAIYDETYDLEKIFESATKARYVLKLTDRAGLSYYGFIGGISVASNFYTFSLYSHVDMATQTWVKTWGTGIASPYQRVEIYEYSTSFQPAASDTFNEELPYSEFATDYDQLKNLADGQYRIDYRRGRFLGRKLDTDDTETFGYITLSVSTGSGSGGGASVGGGGSTYSNIQGDFTATANAAAKTITLSSFVNNILSATISTLTGGTPS